MIFIINLEQSQKEFTGPKYELKMASAGEEMSLPPSSPPPLPPDKRASQGTQTQWNQGS